MIPKFPLGMRAINKRGRLVAERLAWGTALVGEATELQEWVDDGEMIVGEIQRAMHGETNPRDLDEHGVRQWQIYGRSMERVAVSMGLPSVNQWLVLQGGPPAAGDEGT